MMLDKIDIVQDFTFNLFTMICIHILVSATFKKYLRSDTVDSFWDDFVRYGYDFDCLMPYLMAAFAWTFLTSIPIYLNFGIRGMGGLVLTNTGIRIIIDKYRYNDGKLKLYQATLIHLSQFIITLLIKKYIIF